MFAAKWKLSQTVWRLISNEGKHHLQMCASPEVFGTVSMAFILK